MRWLIGLLLLIGVSGRIWAQNPRESAKSVGAGVQWTGVVPGFSAKIWVIENLGLQPTLMTMVIGEWGFWTGDLRMLYRTTRRGRIHPYFGAGVGIGHGWAGERRHSWGGAMLFTGAELIFLLHFGPEIGFFMGRPVWGGPWVIMPMAGFGIFWYF